MKVIVIGCTHAGIAAVREILKNYPDAKITVYERQSSISYLSCATYLHIEGTVNTLSDALYAEPEDFEQQGVDMEMNHDVVSLDVSKHSMLIQDLNTREMESVQYDKLIVATGSITAIPTISGIENPKVLLCKTYNQARDLCRSTLDKRRIAVIGGGYVGVELAEGYIKSGHEVLLFQQSPYLLDKYVEPLLSKAVKQKMMENGVKVITNAAVKSFSDTEDGKLLVKTKDEEYVVDMAAISAGIIPQTDLLQGQVDMEENGAIITDEYMYTSNPDVLAAGDAAVVHYNPTKSNAYSPLASHAVRQGTLAGINIFDRRVRSIGTQSTTGMLVFNETVATTGLTIKDAKKANLNVSSVIYEGSYRPDFMPDAHKVTVILNYDRNSRKILGAQLMSRHDVSQSANTISALIQNGGTIDQLALLDMLFSPNFNNTFDYLNLAGQKAVDQENGYSRT
ncbi:nadh oxidase [Companilactobacillus tucceti DSM 20183]|uniref:Nadh oxidase n=1 Tax=Companilactobacillus tucceti DSM 20183 TaxID=1423811 RepID=A0A0R1J5R7_9LACO|nr:FAD-dependent oxidoreductase [Companilactobacillus tucceti]KRK63793.1 nadh oxidase [Companilactobacillus tucceti DSM 20183]